MKQTFLRFTASIALGALACTSYAQTQPANLLLHDLASQLGGTSSFAKWTNLSSNNPNLVTVGASTASGTLGLIGAFQATGGAYSFRNDFGTVSTASNGGAFDIKTVVLQVAMMPNFGSEAKPWTFEDHFNYNHSDHYQPGDVASGSGNPNDPNGASSYGYVERLGAMKDLLPGYSGGPLLMWHDEFNHAHYMQATAYGHIGEPVEMELGHANGYFYNFAWQWDLSAIPANIHSVEIITPTIVHSSTIGLQITIGDTYTLVVPEPSVYAALIGLCGLGYVLVRRSRAARKRGQGISA